MLLRGHAAALGFPVGVHMSHQHAVPAAAKTTGWLPDPWAPGWRWRSRGSWTPYRIYREERPRLPPWLSVPVLVLLPVSAWETLSLTSWAPGAALLIIPPLVIVLVVFRWIDTVAPEPRQGRLHALIWGFVIAGSVSGLVNNAVAMNFGTFAASVLSAPLIEEVTKGALVLWAVRRSEIDGPVDGAIYAAWSAAGFAASENLYYFVDAAWEGWLVDEFISRGLFMPLAHPMFTIIVGIAVGRAVRNGTSTGIAFGFALVPAIAAHSLWNYGVVLGEEGMFEQAGAISALFLVLFLVWALTLTGIRKAHAKSFEAGADRLKLATKLLPSANLTAAELDGLADPAGRRARRRALPSAARRRFDDGIILYSRAMLRSRSDDAIAPIEFQVFLDHLSSTPGRSVAARKLYPPPQAPRQSQALAAETTAWWSTEQTGPGQGGQQRLAQWWQ